MKRIALVTFMLVAMLGLFAANQSLLLAKPEGTASDTMFTASQLYEMGRYDQAAQAYQQLVDKGYADSALYYNLGNTFYKEGDHGRAILNYRRAQQLAPRDEDISANLELVRGQAVDQFEADEAGAPSARLDRVIGGWLTLNEIAMAALGLWILLVFLLLVYVSIRKGSAWRRRLLYPMAITGVVLVVSVLALGSLLTLEHGPAPAVVVAVDVGINSGPGEQYATEVQLHSGAEVELLETRGSWSRISLPGGELQGWVPNPAVETVDT